VKENLNKKLQKIFIAKVKQNVGIGFFFTTMTKANNAQ
jgi:hypothetical protein